MGPEFDAAKLISSIDPHLLIGIAIAGVFSLTISLFPLLCANRYISLLSIAAAVGYHWRAFTGFLVVIGIVYGVVRWLNRENVPSRRWNRACLTLFLLVVVFALGRLQHWDRPVAVFGSIPTVLYSLDMWLMLRLVTLIWEVGSGTIALPSFSRYVIWTCLPFTLGGPVLRLSETPMMFHVKPELWKSLRWWMDSSVGAAKLIFGLGLGIGQQMMFSHWPRAPWWIKILGAFLTGPVGFYLTTAGYFQLMEVFALPAGFKIPPSFNFPIGRENISAFWMNWNMTATFVFRDYLFFNRWGQATYNIYFNAIVLFTLVGLWHAANAYWILWGFVHGLLFCGFLIWRKYNQRLGQIPLRGTQSLEERGTRTYLCLRVYGLVSTLQDSSKGGRVLVTCRCKKEH